ncbi:MAG: acyl-CoA thioester hydrolase/BAAT C-terminal domain-containing protein [Gaiella sp.]
MSRAPAWTYRGKPLLGPIPVERSSGPLFVVGGSDDRLWPSGASVRRIARRMHLHGRSDIVALDYADAGHLIGTVLPEQVIVNAEGYGRVDSPYGLVELGGTPVADEQAREDAWPRLLRFLARIPSRLAGARRRLGGRHGCARRRAEPGRSGLQPALHR